MWYIIILVALAIYIIHALIEERKEKQNESVGEKPQQPPIKFELLNDNGDTQQSEPVVQELEYFCIKDKGYHVSVWPKDAGMQHLDYIDFPIAGMSYRENIDDYIGEHVGSLEEEPDNEYDANAIKVLAADGHHLGYVPRDTIFDVRKFTTLPCTCYVYIGENDGIYFSDCYIKI